MPLAAGAVIGPYEITACIGAGGMGEVYRARDTRLKREVALKVLPDHFASDPDRLARFQREAEVLASLNHPHIAAVHGLEESDGVRALVLELVEGETLAERIARGRVPLDEAVPIAQQIAEALQAAHEQGIIHRDLKPANIKLTPDGVVKVLDFGLAKLVEPSVPVSPATIAPLTMSPTVASPTPMTSVGVLLGTAAYMSPEQAKGRPADKRSDIWAFGCVFYEMLTARRPFEGDDVSDTLASVLKSDPDWVSLRGNVPPAILRLLECCLAKDRRRRIADISAVQFVLTEATSLSAAGSAARGVADEPRRLSRRTVLTAAGAGLSGAALTGVSWWWLTPPRRAMERTRFEIRLPEGQSRSASRHFVAISPDGTKLAYAADLQVFIRRLDEWEFRPIYRVTDKSQTNPTCPVFSPDNQSIAFWAEGFLKSIPVTGGTAAPLAQVDNPFGMSWSEANIILIGQGEKGIVRVSANGGAPEQVVMVGDGEFAHGPQMLPGGDSILFTLSKETGVVALTGARDWDEADVVVQSLASGMRKLVAKGSDARYLPTRHLVYAVGGTINAKTFDPRTRTESVRAVPVLSSVRRSLSGVTGAAQFSVSETGSLTYVPGSASGSSQLRSVVISSLNGGAAQRLQIDPAPFAQLRASRDGTRIAYGKDDGREADIWVFALTSKTAERKLTFDGRSRHPVWSPDDRIAFQSERNGIRGIFSQPANGGAVETLTKADEGATHIPESFSSDGKHFLFSILKDSVYSLYILNVADKRAVPFGNLKSGEPFNAVVSPNDRWLAYYFSQGGTRSNQGTYVQSFPAGGTPYLLPKSARDYHPAWSPESKRIYYVPLSTSRLVAVDMIQTQTEVTFGKPVEMPNVPMPGILSTGPRAYDVLRDGRFICLVPESDVAADGAPRSQELRVVTNWFEELKRLVPAQ